MANVACNIGQLQNLPFFNLTNTEFNNVVSSVSLKNYPDLDLYQFIPNPDKSDDIMTLIICLLLLCLIIIQSIR